jgi:hypothetical protein
MEERHSTEAMFGQRRALTFWGVAGPLLCQSQVKYLRYRYYQYATDHALQLHELTTEQGPNVLRLVSKKGSQGVCVVVPYDLQFHELTTEQRPNVLPLYDET